MIERFYRKIFIAIVHDGGGYDLRIVVLKQGKELYKKSERFEGGASRDDMIKYLRHYVEESPLHYVAILNTQHKQGALSGCTHHSAEDLEEISGTKTLCRDGKWLLYSSLRELDTLQYEYKKVGLDFIFSPFSILEHFFADKIHGAFALFALALKDSFSVAIFEQGKLEYAHYYPAHERDVISTSDEGDMDGFSVGIAEIPEAEKSISLDDIESLDDLDILDELDDLSNIEDLDSLDEIVEFSEDEPTFEESRQISSRGDDVKQQMDRFNNDYYRFELIQRTLMRFYGSAHCNNRFVETVYVADGYGSGIDLKRYLEEELFLNVLVRHIDVADQVIGLSMIEEGEL